MGLRLAIGFEFLWAFLDKTFGLGYTTSTKHAWIHGGSPTKGFLSGPMNSQPFTWCVRPAHSASRSRNFWIFPVGVFGSCTVMSMSRGVL